MTALSEDITCLKCNLPAMRDGLTFWCVGCGARIEFREVGG
jgi:hypothetical protein